MLWRMQRHAQQLHCKYYNIIIWPQEPSILPYEPLITVLKNDFFCVTSVTDYSITVFENDFFFALQALRYNITVLKNDFLRQE